MMKTHVLLLLLILNTLFVNAQSDSSSFAIAFYNTENFFDPANDSLKNDDAYTPDGSNRWSYKKMYHKRDQLVKVFLSMNEWNPPDLIGLAEIENTVVLKALISHPGMKKYGYHFIHFESPDTRGIDVAVLYRSTKVTILETYPISIQFPFDPVSNNRFILYVKALTLSSDTIHFLVNHWTSRFGGAGATILKRNFYAQVLREKVDSLKNSNRNALICIVGDFNDYPTDFSLYHILKASEINKNGADLVNLMLKYSSFQNMGTHKNEVFWGCLDQIILSAPFIDSVFHFQILEREFIYSPDFLLMPDEKYGGFKPFRTFTGLKHTGGFSDHLPVIVVFTINKRGIDSS